MDKQHNSFTVRTMEKVIVFEKKRSNRSIWFVRICLIIALVIIASCIGVLSYQMRVSGTMDVFSLILEDREIVADYWQEMLFVIGNELPTEYIYGVGAAFAFFIIMTLATRRSHVRSARLLTEISRLERSHKTSERSS